jgi:RecJ-like exonuclease
MTPREGRTCPLCGAVMEPWAELICDQCEEWQEIAQAAEAAADFARSEADDQRAIA